MVEGRGQLEWGQTAWLLATMCNLKRDSKKPSLSPDLFNPFAEPKPKPAAAQVSKKEQFRLLRQVFVGK